MTEGQRKLSVLVSVLLILLVAAIQVLSWQRDGRLSAGAFLLLIFAIVPLWAALRRKRTDRT